MTVAGEPSYADLEADGARLDMAQRLLIAADFATDYGPVVMLRIPPGVGIGADLRAFLDAAMKAEPIR